MMAMIRRRALPIYLLSGLTVAIFGRPAYAQQVQLKNDPAYPLQIVSVNPSVSNATTFKGAKVTVQDMGKAPCVAFSVGLVFELSNFQTRRVTFREDHNALGYSIGSSSQDQIPPGETYTMPNTSGVQFLAPKGTTITGIEALVDYAEMSNGKKYGQDPDRLGELFGMMRWTRGAERKRLLNLYNTQGLQALLAAMERQ